MKHIALFILIISIILGSCAPSDSAIQTAIAETKTAQVASVNQPLRTPSFIVTSAPTLITEASVTVTPTSPASELEIDYALSFISGKDKNSQIEVMNIDGSRRLSIYKGIIQDFDWSSDGENIVLVEQDAQNGPQIAVLDIDTDSVKVLVQPEKITSGFNERYYAYHTPRFVSSKDLFYLAQDPLRVGYEIRKVSFEGKQQDLPPSIQQGGQNGLDVSASGVVVYQTFGNAPPKFGNGLSTYNNLSNNIVDIVPIQPIFIGTPSWSPDGEWIVFPASSNEKNTFEGPSSIWIIKKDRSELRKIVTGESNYSLENPVWAPDGNWIAFSKTRISASGDRGDSDIWLASINEDVLINLTNTPNTPERNPTWNPVPLSSCKLNPISLNQWNLIDINLEDALNQFINCKFPSIHVAVVDTGIDADHPSLDGKIIYGKSDTLDNSLIEDVDGHGTHVAGIIASIGTYPGVHPNARLGIYKVSNAGTFLDQSIMKWMIKDAVDAGARVINVSLGKEFDLLGQIKAAVEYAENHDPPVVIVAAAGEKKDGTPGYDGDYYPAAYAETHSNVIAVAASTPDHELGYYVITGNYITIVAPGGAGKGCLTERVDCIWSLGLEGGDAELEGTSVAAPHVTGVIALMLSANPFLTPGQIKSILVCTSTKIIPPPSRNGEPIFGDNKKIGILNASDAVKWAEANIFECKE
jgi:hypothetical protein